MPESAPHARANIAGYPLHVMLVPVPFTCFLGALITDIAYACTANMQWANFSAWLLAAGSVAAVLAVLAGLTDFLSSRRIRAHRTAWLHALGNAAALVLAIFNSFVHSRDAWTSVVPAGLALSALTVLILLVTGWMGWTLVHRHGPGVEARP